MAEMRIDQQEAFEILVSILAIALAFTFYDVGLKLDPSTFVFSMAAMIATVGIGFVAHELMHKYYAIKFGARARFQAWPLGLALALALAVLPQLFFGVRGFLFIAPGAVYIYSMRQISRRENGIISIAGPLTNIILAVLFLFPLFLFDIPTQLARVLGLGFSINAWLAFFNLIPIFPLDGSKVIAWDMRIWLGAILLSLLLLSMPGRIG